MRADHVFKAFTISVHLYIKRFDHAVPQCAWTIGLVTLNVAVERFLVLSVGFESSTQPPHARPPPRAFVRQNADGPSKAYYCLRITLLLVKCPAGKLLDPTA